LREQDLNLRPSGYEPDELPGCSIPRLDGCAFARGGMIDESIELLQALFHPNFNIDF